MNGFKWKTKFSQIIEEQEKSDPRCRPDRLDSVNAAR